MDVGGALAHRLREERVDERMIGASFSVSRRSATSGNCSVSLARSTESPKSSTIVSAADGSRV
jgi:hypothetical protein